MRGVVIAPRWRKATRDLLERRGRSALTVIALAAGMFEIGAMLYTYAVLRPELTTMYARTHPASATLVVDRVSDALVDSVRAVRGVAMAEARPVLFARARVGPDEWVPAILYVVRDFDHQRIDTFTRERGAWPPGDGEVVLERSALAFARVAIGDSLTVRTSGGEDAALRVAGTVHAQGLPPAWMDHMVPGFVTWRSVLRESDRGESAQIRIVVADHPLDEGYIREVADSTRAMLERNGHTVARINVPTPGRHPHADQMEAFLFLVLAFGILSFVLSAVLVATMINALMAEQLRQVGVMKAIGASSRQIAGLYLGQVSILSSAALIVGVPFGIFVGRSYAQFSAGILNADITHSPFPVWLVLAEIVAGIVVPFLVALAPIARASRITVREALNDDAGSRPFGARRMDRWFARIEWLPRPLALSLRSTFVRRGRLAVTVLALAIGGAAFMSALNVSKAWTRAVDADFAHRRYDLSIGLSRATSVATLDRFLTPRPEVAHVEYWSNATPYLLDANGVAGSIVTLVGPDPGSRLLELPMIAGRWLRADDLRGAVINRAIAAAQPSLRVGDSVRVRFGGRAVALPIVGVTKEVNPMPTIYAAGTTVRAITGQSGDSTRSIQIVTRRHDDAGQLAAARGLERAFQDAGIEVAGLQRMRDARKSILDHLVIIVSILTIASLIVVFVGGLGLASAVMLSVVQRTREFGILGAIGATPGTITLHVWFESALIGILSWGVANLIAIPISYALEAVCGSIFFKAPLDFTLSPAASGLWLALALVIASLSSITPARRATRLTVREALSHV